MTVSSNLHNTGTYIVDIIHSAVTVNRRTSDLLFANYMYIFLQIQDNRPVEIGVEYVSACFSTLSQSPILISEYSGLFKMECNIDALCGIKCIFRVLISHSMDFSTILHGCATI